MNKHGIDIVEVGPRDGLQNESKVLSTSDKVRLIELLIKAGLTRVEVGSFVSAQRIPQLQDTAEVLNSLNKSTWSRDARCSVLVPNRQGLENALGAGAKEIAVFIAASETFSQKNINCSIEESLQRIKAMQDLIKQKNIQMRGYLSCVLGCPFEGKVPVSQVLDLTQKLFNLGCYEVSLGDTIGVGTVTTASALMKALKSEVPMEKIAIHFHDTYGQALVNIYACLDFGVRVIDASITGLGGCPYAPGASGNVATEDVVYLLQGLGLHTSIDMDLLLEASRFVNDRFQRPPRSRVSQAMVMTD